MSGIQSMIAIVIAIIMIWALLKALLSQGVGVGAAVMVAVSALIVFAIGLLKDGDDSSSSTSSGIGISGAVSSVAKPSGTSGGYVLCHLYDTWGIEGYFQVDAKRGLNLREGLGTEYPVIKALPYGTEVFMPKGQTGTKYASVYVVIDPECTFGYVAMEYLSDPTEDDWIFLDDLISVPEMFQ